MHVKEKKNFNNVCLSQNLTKYGLLTIWGLVWQVLGRFIKTIIYFLPENIGNNNTSSFHLLDLNVFYILPKQRNFTNFMTMWLLFIEITRKRKSHIGITTAMKVAFHACRVGHGS